MCFGQLYFRYLCFRAVRREEVKEKSGDGQNLKKGVRKRIFKENLEEGVTKRENLQGEFRKEE